MSLNRIKDSFNKQGLMKTLSAELVSVKEGEVIICSEFSENLTQQHGYFHAGVTASIADSACGYAALTLAPERAEVLSIEFKLNLLRPANTKKLIAIGRVIKAGKTISVCEATVYDESKSKLVAKMTATLFIDQTPRHA